MDSPIDMTADNFVQIFRDGELIKNPLNDGMDLTDGIQGNSFMHGQRVSNISSLSNPLIKKLGWKRASRSIQLHEQVGGF